MSGEKGQGSLVLVMTKLPSSQNSQQHSTTILGPQQRKSFDGIPRIKYKDFHEIAGAKFKDFGSKSKMIAKNFENIIVVKLEDIGWRELLTFDVKDSTSIIRISRDQLSVIQVGDSTPDVTSARRFTPFRYLMKSRLRRVWTTTFSGMLSTPPHSVQRYLRMLSVEESLNHRALPIPL